ncbi:MAG: BNR-4 repeat-containing protein [Pirellulales bacterium]|nr:BNR-4 repeat-containing protein [Pirellulales bacterium]
MKLVTRTVILALILFSSLICQLHADTAAPKGVPFNGHSSYAVVEDGKAFDLDAFTLAAWVKNHHSDHSEVFLSRGEAGQLFTFYIYNGHVRMLVQNKSDSYLHADAPQPKDDKWTHYAGTYDGRNIKLYVNGRLHSTVEAPGRMPKSDAPLYIGAQWPWIRTLSGRLDDVQVWSKALSAEEIAQVTKRKPVTDALVARWTSDSLDKTKWANTTSDKLAAVYHANPKMTVPKVDGYRGIWYSNQPQDNEYVYKYSGGLGTYCAKHRPFAVYCKKVDKTFFCYGGSLGKNRSLLHMASYFDHKTGMVPRPTVIVDKKTKDAHDNPVISMDDTGHIWVFSSSHGTGRPSYIWVSKKPYDISDFEQVHTKAFALGSFEANFSYPQIHYIPGQGFQLMLTIYHGGRTLYSSSSPDGRTWTKPKKFAQIEQGHYQVSERCGRRIGTSFNFHPKPKGLNWRTNLYYMETNDLGNTWTTVDGKRLDVPLTEPDNPALVHDYRAEKKNVYMKDITFDAEGNPVVLYITSGGWEAGPKNDPRTWCTARWTGKKWDIQGSIKSDNNYDMGSLYIEADGTWRIIAPTQTGPQPYNPGGEVAMWTSNDQGVTWKMIKQLTAKSEFNHTYCRRPINAHPDFYALWADGHGRQPSESRLYFTNRAGDHVWKLPEKMEGQFSKPEIVK